jgi:hypothetical protein
MGFCSKCGEKLEEGVKFCPKCGFQTGSADLLNSEAIDAAREKVKSAVNKIPLGVTGLVLGILAAIFGWIPGVNYVSWILGIVGIIFSVNDMSKAKKQNQPIGMCTAGLVLSIIGLAFSFIGLICTVCVGAVGKAAMDIPWY